MDIHENAMETDKTRENSKTDDESESIVGPDMQEVTPEQVGVLKVLKIAIELKKFSQRKQEEGRTEYTIGELLETVILPITRL